MLSSIKWTNILTIISKTLKKTNNVSTVTSEKENFKNLCLLYISHVYFSLQFLKSKYITWLKMQKKLEMGEYQWNINDYFVHYYHLALPQLIINPSDLK